MAEFSEMPVLDVWYSSIGVEDLMPRIKDEQTRKRFQKRIAAARRAGTMNITFPRSNRLPAGRRRSKTILH